MKLIIGKDEKGKDKILDLTPTKQKEKKNPLAKLGKGNDVPFFFDDSTDMASETDLAMAVKLLLNELKEMRNLHKTAVVNATQAHAIARVLNISGYKVIPSMMPITDDILRLSMSVKGIRSEQLKEMVIGQKTDAMLRNLGINTGVSKEESK